MSACAHRPEEGCVFVPCARYDGGERRVCECAVEVKQDQETAQAAQNRPLAASEVTSG